MKGKKGRAIKYDNLKLADYLCPNNILDLEEQRLLFHIRSETNSNPENVGRTEACQLICGEHYENHHILFARI